LLKGSRRGNLLISPSVSPGRELIIPEFCCCFPSHGSSPPSHRSFLLSLSFEGAGLNVFFCLSRWSFLFFICSAHSGLVEGFPATALTLLPISLVSFPSYAHSTGMSFTKLFDLELSVGVLVTLFRAL